MEEVAVAVKDEATGKRPSILGRSPLRGGSKSKRGTNKRKSKGPRFVGDLSAQKGLRGQSKNKHVNMGSPRASMRHSSVTSTVGGVDGGKRVRSSAQSQSPRPRPPWRGSSTSGFRYDESDGNQNGQGPADGSNDDESSYKRKTGRSSFLADTQPKYSSCQES